MKKDSKKEGKSEGKQASYRANIALYRKYRPENWGDVIGQDHIVKAISGALNAGKISHAYLLCGPRGTGKTTIARIIANELNTSPSDIYELDAASNRGIDDVRNIRENVNTLPFDSKYKVYILDEVHMFTKDAWNALLKTIEEPPAHVIFILATTELEKVPETIISRCQSFVFKKPTDIVLSEVISSVAKKEGYKLEDGGAKLIALLADGAFRDALGTLEKVISFSKDNFISIKEIEEVTGAPTTVLVEGFLESIKDNDIEKGFGLIKKAVDQNIDIDIYITMILSKLRYALIFRYAPSMKEEFKGFLNDHDIDYLSNLIFSKPPTISSNTLSILLEASNMMKNTSIPQMPLEMALIKILNAEK